MAYFELVKNQVYNGTDWVDQVSGLDGIALSQSIFELATFEGREYWTHDDATIASGATFDLGLTVGSIITVLAFTAFSSASAVVTLYEGSTFTGGTPITRYNKNRNFADDASDMTTDENPTVTVIGTAIFATTVGSGSGGNAASGDLETDAIILKANTKYVIRILSGAAGNLVNINTNFFEGE